MIGSVFLLIFVLLPLAAGILLVGLSRRGGLGYPACGNCTYDLSGSIGVATRCPECGQDFAKVGIVPPKGRRNRIMVWTGVVLIVVPLTWIGARVVLMLLASRELALIRQHIMEDRQAVIREQQQASKPAPPRTVQPPAPPRPAPVAVGPLRIDPGGFDFGIIKPKSTHDGTITLHNTGVQPITIVTAKPTCLCTVPQDLAGTIIPAGESIPFSASFNAPTEPGLKTAKIQLVFTHGGRRQNALVNLQGLIAMAVRAEPPYVDALKGVTSGRARVESVDGRPFRIISTDGEPPTFIDGFNPKTYEPRNAYTVQWSVEPRSVDDCEGARLWWAIETDHPDCPILPMRIRHECTGVRRDVDYKKRGWRFEEYIANLGGVRGGESVEVDIELPNDAGVPIVAVESMTPDAEAELVSTSRKGGDTTVCRVRFTPRAGYVGMLYAMVMFHSETGSKDIAFITRVLPPDAPARP